MVFYPAGFTWVDGCERDPGRARAANLEQPMNLACAAAEMGARFVYFSTDYVFDGRSGPTPSPTRRTRSRPTAAPSSTRSRALAELPGPPPLIVRTTWVYGPERQGKNFAYQLARTLGEGRELVCPSDQVSSPSYGPDVARAVVALVEQGRSGLVHVAGPEVVDRVQFARALAEGFGLDAGRIAGKTTAELGQGAPRPLNSGLLTLRLDEWCPGVMRPLAESLADFRDRLAKPAGGVPRLTAACADHPPGGG